MWKKFYKKIQAYLYDLGIGNDFSKTSKVHKHKGKIDNMIF